MTLDFHYYTLSYPCRVVELFLKVSGTPYVEKWTDLSAGDQKKPEFKAMGSLGKVPCINDGGFVVNESVAILKYLANSRRLPDHWYPKDAKARCRVDEFLAWQHSNINRQTGGIFYAAVIAPKIYKQAKDEEAIKKSKEEMCGSLDVMEGHFLKDREFLAGKDISIADILAIVTLDQTEAAKMVDPTTGRPRLAAWAQRVRSKCGAHYTAVAKRYNECIAKFA